MRALPFRRDSSVVPFLLAVVCPFLLFTLLASGVQDGGTFSWDRKLVEFFDEHYYELDSLRVATKALVYLAMATGALLAVVVFTALMALQRRRQALFWTLAVAGAVVLSPVLKSVFQRPQIGDPDGEYSFPSGNAIGSMAVVVSLFLLLSHSRRRLTVALAGAALVPLYGLALVLLLWHYPSDVIAGWCIALAWVTGLWLVLRGASEHDAADLERAGCSNGACDVNTR